MSAPYEAPLLAGCSRCRCSLVLYIKLAGEIVRARCWRKEGSPWR